MSMTDRAPVMWAIVALLFLWKIATSEAIGSKTSGKIINSNNTFKNYRPPKPQIIKYMVLYLSGSSYKIVKTDTEKCIRITTIAECNKAASALKNKNLEANDNFEHGVSRNPPYCYLVKIDKYTTWRLRFDPTGTNYGKCTIHDQCVCKK